MKRPKVKIVPDGAKACPGRIVASKHGALVSIGKVPTGDGGATMFIQVVKEKNGDEALHITLMDGHIYTAQPSGNVLRVIARRD